MGEERDPLETDWQKIVHHPQEDDEWPVPLSRFQALKCAAIAGAVVDGHEGYLPALRDVEAFLQSLAAETGHISSRGMTSTEGWQRVNSWPWPRVGRARGRSPSNAAAVRMSATLTETDRLITAAPSGWVQVAGRDPRLDQDAPAGVIDGVHDTTEPLARSLGPPLHEQPRPATGRLRQASDPAVPRTGHPRGTCHGGVVDGGS